MQNEILRSLLESAENLRSMANTHVAEIARLAQAILDTFRRGGRVVLFGNGGSASDAEHIACELVGRFEVNDRRALPAIALSTNTSLLTAVSNDYGYEQVFARQVEALVTEKDTVIGLSTSGNSRNVIEAMRRAREKGAVTIGLTGKDGGALADVVDIILKVPSARTPRIQEAHIAIGHIVCMLVERGIAVAPANLQRRGTKTVRRRGSKPSAGR